MNNYLIRTSNQFLEDFEKITDWIITTNIDQSTELAFQKVDELNFDFSILVDRLQKFPESGEIETVIATDTNKDIRKFPIFNGRYSVKWTVNHSKQEVTLLTLKDSKYPEQFKTLNFD